MSAVDRKAPERLAPPSVQPATSKKSNPGSGWVRGQSYVHIGGLGKANPHDPVLQALSQRQDAILRGGQEPRLSSGFEFELLEVDKTTTLTGAVVRAFTSAKSAFFRVCPSIGTAKAAENLFIEDCPDVQSAGAKGWLAIFRSNVKTLVKGYSSLTYLPSTPMQLRVAHTVEGVGIRLLPPAPPKPVVEPAKEQPPLPPPSKKTREYCTRTCAVALLTVVAATTATVWGYFNYNNQGDAQ